MLSATDALVAKELLASVTPLGLRSALVAPDSVAVRTGATFGKVVAVDSTSAARTALWHLCDGKEHTTYIR